MKNYNEIAESVFSRRDKALEEKSNRRKTAKSIIIPIICLCAVVGAIIGIGQAEWKKEIVPSQTSLTAGATEAQNKIIINTELPEEINSYSGVADICYDIYDFVPMTKDELRVFYGTEIFPWTPDDLAEYVGHLGAGKAELYGIYRADGGTGDVINDNLLIIYTNREAEGRRCLEIEVSKKYRYLSVNNWGSIQSHTTLANEFPCSIINGTEVYIYHNLKVGGRYEAVFIYNDVGFSISADSFSESELVKVIESLTECGDKYKGSEYDPNPVLPMIQSYEGDGAVNIPKNGEVIMSPALLNATEHYGDMAKYNVTFTVFESGVALDVKSDAVNAERIRLKELGYTVYYTEYTTETPNVYGYDIGFHASLDELEGFTANENYGYIITLCNE